LFGESLVDEDLSPTIALKLPELGFAATHVNHLNLSSTRDDVLWEKALERDEIVITANYRDFLRLAVATEAHCGLIILREGHLDREQQWVRVDAAIAYLRKHKIDALVNQALEVYRPGDIRLRELPP
jgi:predicted nuclease of predicted toxin-antitoxin system